MKSLNNPTVHNIDWVISRYRPLLQALHLQQIKSSPEVTSVKNFRELFLTRCIVVTQMQNITDNQPGYFTFINDKADNLFILSIVINEKLFANNKHELRVERKAVAVHEFVHCVAVMLSLSRMGENPNPLLDSLGKSIREKINIHTEPSFSEIFDIFDSSLEKNTPIISDSHFRLGFEEFEDDYVDLYFNFLFSYSLFNETFSETLNLYFKNNDKNKQRFLEELKNLLNALIDKKALNKNFAFQKFITYLSRYVENRRLQKRK